MDVLAKLALTFKTRNLVLVLGTSPTSVTRILELFEAASLKADAVVACTVGKINAACANRQLVNNKNKLRFCVVRGKVGGSGCASALLNSLTGAGAGAENFVGRAML